MNWCKWIILAVLFLLPGATLHACPMCKDSISTAESAEGSSLSNGFNRNVFCLLGGLFGAFGLCATAIAKGMRDGSESND